MAQSGNQTICLLFFVGRAIHVHLYLISSSKALVAYLPVLNVFHGQLF